jgi:hypothetical protein
MTETLGRGPKAIAGRPRRNEPTLAASCCSRRRPPGWCHLVSSDPRLPADSRRFVRRAPRDRILSGALEHDVLQRVQPENPHTITIASKIFAKNANQPKQNPRAVLVPKALSQRLSGPLQRFRVPLERTQDGRAAVTVL